MLTDATRSESISGAPSSESVVGESPGETPGESLGESLGPAAPSRFERWEYCQAPLLGEQEWANALTHGGAALVWAFGAVAMSSAAIGKDLATSFCCLVFVASAVSVFAASALSHQLIHDPPLLRRLRAWDQGLIYAMISGTYTPLIWQFSEPRYRLWLLLAIWLAAGYGLYSKVFVEHRVDSIGTVSYLLLGWLPAIGLVGRVPPQVLFWMGTGGVIYTIGVILLMNDRRFRYLHAAWHVSVFLAASCHFWAIYRYVAAA